MQATIELIHEKGEQMEGITVREICKNAGVGLGLVNYHFGNMTLTFLFEHYAVSKISILSDMRAPKEADNTHRTYLAYLPLVSGCRPDWDKETLERKTFCLITTMQQSFLRHKVIKQFYGTDLMIPEERKVFHRAVLQDILEV